MPSPGWFRLILFELGVHFSSISDRFVIDNLIVMTWCFIDYVLLPLTSLVIFDTI